MGTTSRKTAKTKAELYDELGVEEKARLELEKIAAEFHAVDQLTAETVYKRGSLFEKVAQYLSEKEMGHWAQGRCRIDVRHTRNYRAVWRNLPAYKDEIIDLGLGATVMFKLAAASPEQVEQALELARTQGHLKVKDVSAIMAEGKEQSAEKPDPFSAGGVVGLKAIGALKLHKGVESLVFHCDEIRSVLEAAVAEPRIKKAELVRKVYTKARLGRAELESIGYFVQPNPDHPEVIWPEAFPAGTAWAEVHKLLETLGGLESWPDAKLLKPWIELHVLPVLAWVTDKGKNPVWTAVATDAKGNLVSHKDQATGTVILFPSMNGRGTVSNSKAASPEERTKDDLTLSAEESDAVEVSVERIEGPLEIAEQVTSNLAPAVPQRKSRKSEVASVG